MIGSPDNPGIMFRSLNDLYNKIEKQKIIKDFIIKVSYLEIYNENIKDLLSADDRNLELREDPIRGVIVNAITEVLVNSTNEIL